MINQVWLKTFCTLAQVKHFTKTADKLFMTQSGVSQHIKKLEQQLGVALLIKKGKSFSLTSAGEELFHQGELLLKAGEALENSIKHNEPHEGRIKIASPGSIGLKLYPYLLDIQKTFPKLVFDYKFSPNQVIEQEVAERKIDLGLITKLSNDSSLQCQQVAVEPLMLVTPHNVNTINWDTLIELGFISHPDAAHHGALLLSQNFKQFEHIDQFVHKGFSNQIGLILEPVSKGLGFTVLPLHAAKAFHQQKLIMIHSLTNTVNESLYVCNNRHLTQTNRLKCIKSVIIDYLSQ